MCEAGRSPKGTGTMNQATHAIPIDARVLIGKNPTSPEGQRFFVEPKFSSLFGVLITTKCSPAAKARFFEGILRFTGDGLTATDCRELAATIREGTGKALHLLAAVMRDEAEPEDASSITGESVAEHLMSLARFLEASGGLMVVIPGTPPDVPKGWCEDCEHVLVAADPAPGTPPLMPLSPSEFLVFLASTERLGEGLVELGDIDEARMTGDLRLNRAASSALGKRVLKQARKGMKRLGWLVDAKGEDFGGDRVEGGIPDLLGRLGEFLKGAGGVSCVRMPSMAVADG